MICKQLHYYQALGIQPWQLKQRVPSEAGNNLANAEPSAADTSWQTLKENVAQCTACSLHATRKQTVFGTGDLSARLMIIGEAPGASEDDQGEPFVGRAGKLLTAMLEAISLSRHEVYIANILKCRPPNNRDPLVAEVKTCTGFLNQQIALVQPTLLLAVGRIAAHYLLNTKSSLESLRGRTHAYGAHSVPLIVTYHPAYLLRSPGDKKKAFVDLLAVQAFLQSSSGEKTHGRISLASE
jgi:DNA polymerase